LGKTSFKIYCAGPIFNPSEQKEMDSIAHVLRNAGYEVFLPQKDGLEFAKLFPAFLERGVKLDEAQRLLNNAIFALDVFQIKDSDGLVLNMNGRVPDEGAMVEAGIAWACQRPIVIFNSDDRSLIHGNSNPLVMGLSDFESVSEYSDIPDAFNRKFSEIGEQILRRELSEVDISLKKGRAISECICTERDENKIADLLLELFGGRTCQNTGEMKRNYSQAPMQQ
jgi:nucleoside 2-deoxyribosyltransferase